MKKHLPVMVMLVWVGASVAFLGFSLSMGGAAIKGKILSAHYYLGSHGSYREVSRAVYVVSALLSGAFGLSLPLFAGVMTWHESIKPSFTRLTWIGCLFALLFGFVMCWHSFRCIVWAFSAT